MAKLFLPHDTSDSQICESPTIEIPLTRGHVAIVDECDADLADFSWCALPKRYCVYGQRAVQSQGKKTTILLHRAVLSRMLGRELVKGEQVDHKDGDGLNNRRSNLRLASHAENNRNRRLSAANNTGFKGIVRANTVSERWEAHIYVNRRLVYLGTYLSKIEAHSAYVEAAKRYFGEFANDGNGPVRHE